MMTNYELRRRMRIIVKPNMQQLLLIALIAALPGLLSSVVTILTGSDLMTWLYQQSTNTSLTVGELMTAMEDYMGRALYVTVSMSILQAVVAPVLTLGLINAYLILLRGGDISVMTAFSRMRAFVRSLLLTLLMTLKLFLWALPGMGVMILGVFLGEGGFVTTSAIGSVLMIVLLTMAVFRYAMANFFLADDPTNGPLVCIRKSKGVMKHRKMQLFSLELPYLAGSYAVSTLISMLLTGVIGTALSLMVQLIFSVHLYGAMTVFFEHYAHPEHIFTPAYENDEMKDSLN